MAEHVLPPCPSAVAGAQLRPDAPQLKDDHVPAAQIEEKAADLQTAIMEGAQSFLFTEYKYVGIFMVSPCYS